MNFLRDITSQRASAAPEVCENLFGSGILQRMDGHVARNIIHSTVPGGVAATANTMVRTGVCL